MATYRMPHKDKRLTLAFNNLEIAITETCRLMHRKDSLKVALKCADQASDMAERLEIQMRKKMGLPKLPRYSVKTPRGKRGKA